jgi:hypothetical protein
MEDLEADIDELCDTHHIDPHLRRVLLTLADPEWGEHTAVFLPLEYKALFRFQVDLHDDSVFLGCFSKDWVKLQHNFLAFNNLPRNKQQATAGIKAHPALSQPLARHVAPTQHSPPR